MIKKGDKLTWKDVDQFTSANIPVTKWMDDSTLEEAHGIGLDVNDVYFEFKWLPKENKVSMVRELTPQEMVGYGIPYEQKTNKKTKKKTKSVKSKAKRKLKSK